MKKRPLLFLLGFLLFSQPAAACDTDLVREYTPISERPLRGMLYVVDNCKSRASFVFGTVHLDDARVREAAQSAFDALRKSKRAFFEIKNSKQSQQETIALMVLPPEEKRTLSEIIGNQTFVSLITEIQKSQYGFPRALLERYRPWAASVLVQTPPPSGDNIHLDDRLQILATELNLPVFGLETFQSQMSVFNQMTDNEQIILLRDTLNNIGKIRQQNDRLKSLYIQGNMQGIESLGHSAFNEVSNSKLRGYMKRSLISERNDKMTKALLPHLAKGRNFVAVGALHLPGKDGILNQLEQAGYFIWPAAEVPNP